MRQRTYRLILCFMLLALLFSGCTTPVLRPEEGIWYCEQLQMQLSFTDSVDTYATLDGQRITCAWGNDRGSKYMSIGCMENDIPGYFLGEEIFLGKYISLTDTAYTVEDCDTGVIYVFERID